MPKLYPFRFAFFILLFGLAPIACGADQPVGEGSFVVAGRTYKLTRFVAYQTKSSDVELISVLASDRNLPLARIKAEVAKGENVSLEQPYLKLTFDTEGKLQFWNGWADNSSFSAGASDVTGELKVEAGRAAGEFSAPPKGEGDLRRSFTMKFNVPLGLDPAPAVAGKNGPSSAVKAAVTGKFLGNGKPAKLAYVSVHRREPFDDKPALQLIFTEKDHAKDPQPEVSAVFGKYGSALLISFSDDGSIFGCEVAHAAHAQKPFSALGVIHIEEFELTDRAVQGQLTTSGEQDAFGQKWDVDVKFSAPLPAANALANKSAAAKPAAAAANKKPSAPPAETKPAAATLNVHDLALPANITDLEYKAIVQQMLFKSPAKVQALAAELTKKLAGQGWRGGDDLVTPKSAILERKRGGATLTIMLKPEGTGSQATVFAEGLDWDGK